MPWGVRSVFWRERGAQTHITIMERVINGRARFERPAHIFVDVDGASERERGAKGGSVEQGSMSEMVDEALGEAGVGRSAALF